MLRIVRIVLKIIRLYGIFYLYYLFYHVMCIMTDLADLVIQNPSYNASTGVVTVTVKNIGNVQATGYTDADGTYGYNRIFSVTNDITQSTQINELPASFPLITNTGSFYQKSQGNYNILVSKVSYKSVHGETYKSIAYQSGNNGGTYFAQSPPLMPGDSITWSFSGNFKVGETMMFSADDVLSDSQGIGDTVETIDNNANPSNNYFTFVPVRQYATPPTISLIPVGNSASAGYFRHRIRIFKFNKAIEC